jgi:NADH-quinone oxidoreductase subunit H
VDLAFLIESLVKVLIVLGFVLLGVPLIVWMERKVLGHMQDRIGPERVGPFGLLQTIADGLKLFMKEDLIPAQADKVVFVLAPALTVITALVALAVIPWGDQVTILGRTVPLHIADVNVALLFVLATTSMGVYGIVLGGWASNSKYPLLGGLRSSAQMISYELAQGISLVSVVLLAGTLSLAQIARQQAHMWYVVPQFFGFVIYVISGIAETNRAPFDLPEAETELVAGFHTEYSSMKWAFYFLGEYANMMVVSGIAITVFLGGWHGPVLPPVMWFLIKLTLFLFFYIWLRATFPRLRYDQLMGFGWKVLLPASLLNLVVTAAVVAL